MKQSRHLSLTVVRRLLRLKRPFGISRGTRAHVENVFVCLGSHCGEAAPVSYHGHTAEMLQQAAESLQIPNSFTREPEEVIHRLSQNREIPRPVVAAIDMAIYDAWAHERGQPLSKLWGVREEDVPTSSYTIGIDTPEQMVSKIEDGLEFPILKIKLGSKDDLSRLAAIREATSKTLRVDANEGWDRETAAWWLERLPDWNVDLVEQPLPRDDHEGMRDLCRKNQGRIPIILDESIQTSEDVLSTLGESNGINIKLAKCGGLLEARKMISIARRHGLKVMVGCMVESSLGISAAAHIAPFVDFVDLDGAALLDDDPFEGVNLTAGRICFRERPGLGVSPREGVRIEPPDNLKNRRN